MTFWGYMLHCNGGAFYVGETDNLERRITQHESGALPGFARDHLPVKLVWSESFQTRLEAKSSEKKLKGWSRAKKIALVRGDWSMISSLAQNAEQNGKAALRQAQGQGIGETLESVE